ncbi:MAG: 4-hydroxy-tetrahydrodipicolinate reductase [Deltaproteobacteria bacterium]|nr:4-hydroxy-tetrahydrodipicolinate reductase [Deltaproteobacteria bacterium]
MGRMVLDCAAERDDAEVSAAVDHPRSPLLGTAVSDVTVTSDVAAGLAGSEVYIDFTTPEATAAAARAAASSKTAAVIGTTGLTDDGLAALDALADVAPVLVAANFSLGVNLLINLAEIAARALAGYDLEVVELHHRRKRDAPSGTAIAVAEALARGRGVGYDQSKLYARAGDVGPRTDDEIGVFAVRGGDIIGEHTAYLVGDKERIELTHRAGSRAIFADGALTAACWLAGKAPGRYSMRDVLEL